jgi:hypothetical protein
MAFAIGDQRPDPKAGCTPVEICRPRGRKYLRVDTLNLSVMPAGAAWSRSRFCPLPKAGSRSSSRLPAL